MSKETVPHFRYFVNKSSLLRLLRAHGSEAAAAENGSFGIRLAIELGRSVTQLVRRSCR
jgi:hypothetical protein